MPQTTTALKEPKQQTKAQPRQAKPATPKKKRETSSKKNTGKTTQDKRRTSGQAAHEKTKQMHNIQLGRRGEDAAVRFLEHRGFSILERNWKCVAGEADIIALDDEAIHFIEVKTRIGEGSGFPEEAVTAKKRRKYESIAELYVSHYDGFETGITFDIIAILVSPNDRAILKFYRNVLSCDCR